MPSSFAAIWIRTLTPSDLESLIEEVKNGAPHATERATAFVVSESFGIWHNRARAKLCRYFKNHPPASEYCQQMVDAIINRLIEGRFSEQFKDQLSMAIRFAPVRMADSASLASKSERGYIRRYAEWVRHTLRTTSTLTD